MAGGKNTSNNSPTYFQVFLRLRPSSPQSSISDFRFLSTAPGQCNIYVTPPERTRARTVDRYSFTKVFDETSQQLDVFKDTILQLVQDAIKGRDGMLATLGVTGSGKTHTILGNKEQRGMIQLSLDVIFNSLDGKMVDYSRIDIASFDHTEAVVLNTPQYFARLNSALDQAHASGSKRSSMVTTTPSLPDVSDLHVEADNKSGYAVLISMYELYNDRIFDLLDETPFINPSARRRALVFRGSSTWEPSKEQKKVVSGLRKVCAHTYAEALQVIEQAQRCRKVSSTNSNLVSSRSHAFLQIEIKRFSSRGIERDSSSLHIVDLAGSERARNAQTAGDRLAEAGSINRSLMILGQCLESQQQGCAGRSVAANWRSSKLTELLFSNSFSGVSKQRAAMIVTADPCGDFNSTLQILRYAALAKEVTVPKAPSVRNISGTSNSGSDIEVDIDCEAGKDALIARLIAQLEETENRWRDAEERCLLIEQSVREELADEMDQRLEEFRREALEARAREEDWREEFVDEKIEILRKGMEEEFHIHEDGDRERLLEEENESLRRELSALKRERANRSPTKLQGNRANVGLKIGRVVRDMDNLVPHR
ncbi:P-loop containing nucleoside triphosphate hydrolase protein [Wilcoxina mikolae CBS 423.85]|nr:P-loop containing nucleoside triphosphate hydrolase protein [Wilcoxina mikolae CBS 423.85]